MKIDKWDFKADGYHPHEPGLRKKLNTMGFDKILLRESKPGTKATMKNNDSQEQAMAFISGRVFVQFSESDTHAFHQGDVIVIPPNQEYRFKTSGDVPSKILLARKSSNAGEPSTTT